MNSLADLFHDTAITLRTRLDRRRPPQPYPLPEHPARAALLTPWDSDGRIPTQAAILADLQHHHR